MQLLENKYTIIIIFILYSDTWKTQKKKQKQKSMIKWPFTKNIYKSQYWSYKLTITTYRIQKKRIPFTKAKKKKCQSLKHEINITKMQCDIKNIKIKLLRGTNKQTMKRHSLFSDKKS